MVKSHTFSSLPKLSALTCDGTTGIQHPLALSEKERKKRIQSYNTLVYNKTREEQLSKLNADREARGERLAKAQMLREGINAEREQQILQKMD